MEEYSQDISRITNRHIAKLLSRLKPLNIPEIAESEIIRQMWFLTDDIFNQCKKEQGE
jgi:hypothetical protein